MTINKKWFAVISAIAAFAILAIILGVLVLENLDWFKGRTNAETTISSSAVVELIYENGAVKHQPVADFNAFVQASDRPVFVDFWAVWCGPCMTAAPFVESLAKDYAGQAHILKVDVDQADSLSKQFKISSIPYFVVLNGGQIKDSATGYAVSVEENLRQMLEKQIG
jgi:thioredoxin 1